MYMFLLDQDQIKDSRSHHPLHPVKVSHHRTTQSHSGPPTPLVNMTNVFNLTTLRQYNISLIHVCPCQNLPPMLRGLRHSMV